MRGERRAFHTRKLENLMSNAGVKTYKELAALTGLSEATIRNARRKAIGVSYRTARLIVRKLLIKKLSMKMKESTGEKPCGGKKSVREVLDEVDEVDKEVDEVLDKEVDEVTFPVSPAS